MLKHILTTVPGNGSVSNCGRSMVGAGAGTGASGSVGARPDSAGDRPDRDIPSKIEDKGRDFSKPDTREALTARLEGRNDSASREVGSGRGDGLGPRTDARGEARDRERNERADHLYRDTSISGRLDFSHGEDKPPESRNDLSSRNVLINRIEYHSREPPTNVSGREYRGDYRGDLTPREHASKMEQYGHHRYQNTGANRIRDPNHSQLSVNAVQRLPQHQPLNISTLNSSKHSLGGTSSSASPGGRAHKFTNGGLNISRVTAAGRGNGVVGGLSTLTPASLVPANVSRFMNRSKEVGIKEMLTSLGLLCLVSLLLALLSLIFLLKISPVTSTDIRELLRAEQLSVISAEEYVVVYEVTLALCALTLSLNLCCLLVCAIQFLFAVKLVNSPNGGGGRTNKYLQKSAVTRVCAVGGFFISIPVFLTGIILYTFIQFHSTPAIVTSVFIGLGIIFCGCAMVHNVFVWQKEKTNAVKAMHSQSQVHSDQPLMNSTQNIGTPQSINANGYITSNGHIPSGGNTTHGTTMSYHNTTGGTSFSHHPISLLPHQGPYIIRPPTSTPPTPGELGGGNRPPRPPRPPAPASASPTIPQATLDLSHTLVSDPHELSTLV